MFWNMKLLSRIYGNTVVSTIKTNDIDLLQLIGWGDISELERRIQVLFCWTAYGSYVFLGFESSTMTPSMSYSKVLMVKLFMNCLTIQDY